MPRALSASSAIGTSTAPASDELRSTVPALVGVLLAAMLQAIDGSIVNVALPQMQSQFGASLPLLGWVVTGYTLANLIAMPLAASLSQRTGLRAYFAGSVILFTLASGACAFAPGTASLLIFRALQGLGAGGLLPLAQGILMTLFPGERRGTAVALLGFATVLGPLFGPPLGGLLTDALGWRSIFWINLPLGVLSTFLVLRFLRAPPRTKSSTPIDVKGIALLLTAVLSLQLACAHHVWLLPLAALCGIAFILHERRSPAPAVELRVLRHPQLASTLVAAALYGVGLYASVFLTPLTLENELHLSAARAGLILSMGGVTSGVLILSARPLLKRFRAQHLCDVGALCFAGSMIWLAVVSWRHGGAAWGAQALRGAGTGILYVGMNAFAFAEVPEQDLATSASLFYLLRQLGGSIGVALCAQAVHTHGEAGAALCFLVLALSAPLAILPMRFRARPLLERATPR